MMDLDSDVDILGELFDECKKGKKMLKVEDSGKGSEEKMADGELFEVADCGRVRFNSL